MAQIKKTEVCFVVCDNGFFADILQLLKCRRNIFLVQLSTWFVAKCAAKIVKIGLQIKKFWSKPFFTQDYLLQGTRRFGELRGKQWKANPTRGSIYPISFSTYVHFRKFNISHIQSLEDEAPACTISLS